MFITYNAAVGHLQGIEGLLTVNNMYLSCVRNYVMSAETVVHDKVRADTIKSHNDLRDLMNLEGQVKMKIDKFLRGEV